MPDTRSVGNVTELAAGPDDQGAKLYLATARLTSTPAGCSAPQQACTPTPPERATRSP